MKRITMIARLLLVGLAIHAAASAPTTRPLEDSPSELAWNAWLQQGSRQAAPPRRITTKSLFVLPHLGPESLPACADGYRPDSMGRCVKVVKVDESAHLDFLLQKLNNQFATETSEGQDEAYDYDIESDSSDSSGPFQFNIPLALASGSRPDSAEPSEEIVLITKKQPVNQREPPKQSIPKPPAPERRPTSSPEVVPEYNDRNQFFLDKVPTEADGSVRQDNSASTGPVSILLHNSSSTGLTLLAPTNGKFENVTSEDDEKSIAAELIKELESVKEDSVKNDAKHEAVQTTTIDPVTELPTPETIIAQSSYSGSSHSKDTTKQGGKETNSDNVIADSSVGFAQTNNFVANTVNNETAANATLLNQIEALKREYEALSVKETSTETNNVEIKTSEQGVRPNQSPLHAGISPASIAIEETSDKVATELEEKIKKISRFADVSRNTEGPFPINGMGFQKKTSDFVRFPASPFNYEADLKKAATSSSPFQFPPDYVRAPPFQNYVGGAYQDHHPVVDYHRDRNFEDSGEKHPPYWLPYGWNVNNPSGEHNLMELWSRMSSMQRYPYNVRFESDRHPLRHQTLYPHEAPRLNARHTPVSYRQGRDGVFGGRQVYQDDSMNYKRSRHPPHFRESQEFGRILKAFSGR